jgi:hypothetical protein
VAPSRQAQPHLMLHVPEPSRVAGKGRVVADLQRTDVARDAKVKHRGDPLHKGPGSLVGLNLDAQQAPIISAQNNVSVVLGEGGKGSPSPCRARGL